MTTRTYDLGYLPVKKHFITLWPFVDQMGVDWCYQHNDMDSPEAEFVFYLFDYVSSFHGTDKDPGPDRFAAWELAKTAPMVELFDINNEFFDSLYKRLNGWREQLKEPVS